jgi:tetrahydromethanopterin S-methyltransferase subunit H
VGTDPRKVTIGGPLGGRTGLLVGSIFYDKHSIVKDAFAGECDATRAEGLIKRVNETHIRYGVQMTLHVIAASEEAMDNAPRTDRLAESEISRNPALVHGYADAVS